MLTAHFGRLENCGTEPGASPVGNTNDTVAASRGPEKVAPTSEAGKTVVAGTRASPIAEH